MTCFKCSSNHIIKNGKTSTGKQKYLCKECGRTFTTYDSVKTVPQHKIEPKINPVIQSTNQATNIPIIPPKINYKQKRTNWLIIGIATWLIVILGFIVGGFILIPLLIFSIYNILKYDKLLKNENKQPITTEIVKETVAVTNKLEIEKSTDKIHETEQSITTEIAKETTAATNKPEIEKSTDKISVVKPPDILEKRYLKYYYPYVCLYTTNISLDNLKVGEWVSLIQEPENEFDNHAIKVSADNLKLGYLYKGTHQDMCNSYISDNNKIVLSKITNIDFNEHKIFIYLAFYNEITTEQIAYSFSVKISGDKYSDAMISEGDEVNLCYDYDKEKFQIDDWAYAPTSFTEFHDTLNSDYMSYIDEITENSNGSYTIKINIIII